MGEEKLTFDQRGKVIPDQEAIRWAEREYSNLSDGDKYRHAQAHTILKAFPQPSLVSDSNSKTNNKITS